MSEKETLFLEIQQKKEEMRKDNGDKTDTSLLQTLINVFGGEKIAQFLTWETKEKSGK